MPPRAANKHSQEFEPVFSGVFLRLHQGVTAEVDVSSDGQCDQISNTKQANKPFEGERRCFMHYSAFPALNFSLWGIVWHPRWIIKPWPFILIKGDAGGRFSSRERHNPRQAVRNATEIKHLVLQRLGWVYDTQTRDSHRFTCATWGIEFGFVWETQWTWL